MKPVEYLLTEYEPFDALERADIECFRRFVSEYGKRIYDRAPGQPSITASAVVVNSNFSKVLLMHHKLHGFYKQFGGHADGNPNLTTVAATELLQESGAMGNFVLQRPFDLIRWNFPDRTKDGIFYPSHDCFDIAFLFQMLESTVIKPNKKEVLDTKWEKLETWRDYMDMKNPVYVMNPQNFDYQQRICKKINAFKTK
jgi:hypothetical protein